VEEGGERHKMEEKKELRETAQREKVLFAHNFASAKGAMVWFVIL
jgi:hypothetical protein